MEVVEFRDISNRLQREHLLSAQNWALSAFSIASLALGRAHTAASLLQTICEAITNQSAYVLAWIGIADEGPEKTIRIAASAGSAAGYLDGLDLSWSEDEPSGRSPTGICVRTGTVQLANDTSTAPAFDAWRERARQFGIRSSASIPLVIKGSWKGALVVYAKSSNAFETAPIEVFQHLSEQVVRGILALEQTQNLIAERYHLEETQKQLTEALTASVGAIVTAMEMRDPYTAGHESRVAEIAVAIGSEMGWNDGRLQGLRMAAMVHDIGKISIPAEILTKPTQLSSGEWTLIREHPETGYSILRKIPFTWPVAEAVRQHHERLDGSGYPRGLKGDAILPEARILAVADIVEAMTCHRPYRPGMALETVLEKIEKDAGTLLDPEVVRVCVKLFREKHLVVPGWNPS
jgi:putative nucleotidyltransferase with HDIG domain